jgi:hypothetical protein
MGHSVAFVTNQCYEDFVMSVVPEVEFMPLGGLFSDLRERD